MKRSSTAAMLQDNLVDFITDMENLPAQHASVNLKETTDNKIAKQKETTVVPMHYDCLKPCETVWDFLKGEKDEEVLWEDIKVSGFDDMVSPDQLKLLCILIGKAIFIPYVTMLVVFEGPPASGKTILCEIIRKLAQKNNVNILWNTKLLKRPLNEKYVCLIMDSDEILIPKNWFIRSPKNTDEERKGFWNIPTFLCTTTAFKSDFGISIQLLPPAVINPDFLSTIDIDLVEKKCLAALSLKF